ncbi:hypothetical protein HYFRA_00011338 [Hymenoscyphus fraxineus]|uniref:Uncharacterized protein n=1 Tax=Hymenoscyphus fraxineus TaxID=746836 RepID=A0A9N9PJ45_9HELO|nr:hypothetical protein HYFRA_00011338 [Hymenoscyphus fraxineus]
MEQNVNMTDKPPTIFKTPSGATFVSRSDIDELQKHGAEFTEAVRIVKENIQDIQLAGIPDILQQMNCLKEIHKAWEKEVDVLDTNEWSRSMIGTPGWLKLRLDEHPEASAVDQLCASEKAQFDRLREELDQRCTIFRIYNNTSDPWRGFEHLVVHVEKGSAQKRPHDKSLSDTSEPQDANVENRTKMRREHSPDAAAGLTIFPLTQERFVQYDDMTSQPALTGRSVASQKAIEEMKTMMNEKSTKIEELQIKYNTAKEDAIYKKKRVLWLEAQVKNMQEATEREKKAMKGELFALSNLTYSQQVTAKDFEAQLELLKTQSEKCKHEKEKAVSELDNFKESHNRKVRDLEKKAQSLEGQLEKKTEENRKEVLGLEEELEKSEGRLRGLEAHQLDMQEAHDKEMQDTLQKLQALQTAISKHNNEYSSLEKKAECYKTELNELRGQLEKEHHNNQEAQTGLRDKLLAARKARHVWRANFDDLKVDRDDLNGKLKSLQTTVRGLERDNEDLKTDLAQSNDDVENMRSHFNQMRALMSSFPQDPAPRAQGPVMDSVNGAGASGRSRESPQRASLRQSLHGTGNPEEDEENNDEDAADPGLVPRRREGHHWVHGHWRKNPPGSGNFTSGNDQSGM